MIKPKIMRWETRVARMGRRSDTYTVLVVETEKRPLGRPRHKWEDNIKIDVK